MIETEKLVRLNVSRNNRGYFDLCAELTEKGKEAHQGSPFEFPYFGDRLVKCADVIYRDVSELRVKGKFDSNGVWKGMVASPEIYEDVCQETIKTKAKLVKAKVLKEIEKSFPLDCS